LSCFGPIHHFHLDVITTTIYYISIAPYLSQLQSLLPYFFFVTPYPPLLAKKKQKYFVSCFYLKSDLSGFRFVLVLQSKGKEEQRVERREKKKKRTKRKRKGKE